MATPILNAEVLKLRRRLGDMYNEDGTEITVSNIDGSTDTGVRYKRDELLDIYNDAIRVFVGYVISNLPYKVANRLIPGYIVKKTAVTLTTGAASLESISPKAYKVIDVKKSSSTFPYEISTEISPEEFFSAENARTVTLTPSGTNIKHCVMGDPTSFVQTLYVLPTSITSVDIIYIRRHVDLVCVTGAGGTDIFGITDEALRKIQIVAEAEARRYKSQDVKDLPDVLLGTMFQFDLKGLGNASNA